jgi:hypothetical protein
MAGPARRASRRSQLRPSLRRAVPRRWRRGIPTARRPFASGDHPAAVSAGFTVGASTSRLATRDGTSVRPSLAEEQVRKRAGTAQDPEAGTGMPVAGSFRIPVLWPRCSAAQLRTGRPERGTFRTSGYSAGVAECGLPYSRPLTEGCPDRVMARLLGPVQRGGEQVGQVGGVVSQRLGPRAAGCYSCRSSPALPGRRAARAWARVRAWWPSGMQRWSWSCLTWVRQARARVVFPAWVQASASRPPRAAARSGRRGVAPSSRALSIDCARMWNSAIRS